MNTENMTLDQLLERKAYLKRHIKNLEEMDALRSVEQTIELKRLRAEMKRVKHNVSLKIVQHRLF